MPSDRKVAVYSTKGVDEELLLLASLPNNSSIYATGKDEERSLPFCLFVACSLDSEAADRLQDSLSLACKFVCLRAQKLGKSFLWWSSKRRLAG